MLCLKSLMLVYKMNHVTNLCWCTNVLPWNLCPVQTIFLQDNAIGQIRQRDLSDLGQLHYLYLQNNSISMLEAGAFRNLRLLLELALNGNRIHLISADVFRGLDHLRILYLAGNQITRLEDYTFHGLQVERLSAPFCLSKYTFKCFNIFLTINIFYRSIEVQN